MHVGLSRVISDQEGADEVALEALHRQMLKAAEGSAQHSHCGS